jgi:predicted PurR-regulated permease PerM
LDSISLLPEDAPPPPPPPATGPWRWYWLIPIGLSALLLYAARAIIAPFVIGAVLAYLLDPLVAAVHRVSRLPRALVVVIMALLALAIFGTIITVLVRIT